MQLLYFFSDFPTDVMCCKFTPDGSMLAVGLIDGKILVSISGPKYMYFFYLGPG